MVVNEKSCNGDKILKELEPTMDELNIPKNDPDAHQKVSYAVRFIKQARNSFLANVEMGTAEANNLLGQLVTNMKVIKEEGLEEVVARNLTIEDQAFSIQNRLIAPEALPEASKTLLLKQATGTTHKDQFALDNQKADK